MSLKLGIKQFTLRHETPVSQSSLRNEVTSFRKHKSLKILSQANAVLF